jgi:hypothetical protein
MDVPIMTLAESAHTLPNGNAYIWCTFDRTTVNGFPFRYQRLALVARMVVGFGEPTGLRDVVIKILNEDGEQLYEAQMQGNFSPTSPGSPGSFEFAATLDGLVLPAAGTYEFALHVDGELIRSIPLYVVAAENQ